MFVVRLAWIDALVHVGAPWRFRYRGCCGCRDGVAVRRISLVDVERRGTFILRCSFAFRLVRLVDVGRRGTGRLRGSVTVRLVYVIVDITAVLFISAWCNLYERASLVLLCVARRALLTLVRAFYESGPFCR